MKSLNLRKMELEITSACNAKCHVCFRTKNVGKYQIESMTLDDIKQAFPETIDLDDFQFLLCGVLGDPVANRQCYEIVEYLTGRGAWCELNTNASLQTTAWWSKLGELSKTTGKVNIWFCVDGHRDTNHYYRVGTDFDLIERNMQAYSDAGGKGKWVYILFDHNLHELDTAKAHAARLNFSFAERIGVSNDMPTEVTTRKKKQKETVVVASTSEYAAHPASREHKELHKDLKTLFTDKGNE